jgi:hypothetical protein
MNTQNKNIFKKTDHAKVFFVFFLSILSSQLTAQSQNNSITNKAVDGGIGLGSIIAVVASWSRNKSILYAIIHGLLGWIYVIYFAFTRED